MLVGQILGEWQYYFLLVLTKHFWGKVCCQNMLVSQTDMVENQCLRLQTKFTVERVWLKSGMSHSQIDLNLGLGRAAHLGCIQYQSRHTGQTSLHHRHSGGALTCWY
jgi:hypothetical protein